MNSKSRYLHGFFIVSFLAGAAATSAGAQGRVVPRHIRPTRSAITTESTHVKVKILDGVADTTVAMSFRNNGSRIGEKIVVLPLPKGASADQIQMEVNGKMQKGELLSKGKALQIYTSIVSRRKDPALLEYFGQDLLRLRVFPIPPKGVQKVKVRFRMLLPESGGLSSYEFPTRAVEGGTFAMEIELESSKALKNVYSPLGGMDIARSGDYKAKASFESKGRPQRDPILFYGLSDRDFGLNMLSYRKKGQKEGYFLLMLAPKRNWNEDKQIEKSITFVIDTSGSMQGAKIKQAKKALLFFLNSLRKNDSFNIIPFSTEARPFAEAPVTASAEQITKAVEFSNAIEARGGTNIHEALTVALAAKSPANQVPIIVFLTDGQPTVGETNIQRILKDSSTANKSGARIFVFGVGQDVNTKLLDKLSLDSGGTRDYVLGDENIEVKTGALFEKLAHPVMSNLRLSVDKINWSRLAPQKIPDLFRGGRLVVAGRYKGAGATAIHLKGRVGDKEASFVFDAQFPEEAGRHDFVATIWAQRRIAQLMDAIRLSGSSHELISEVTRLGKEHGIVTPYTSQLIVEEGERIASSRGRRMNRLGDLLRQQGLGGRPTLKSRRKSSRSPGSPTPTTGGPARKGAAALRDEIVWGAELKKLNKDLLRAGVKLDPKADESGSDSINLGRGRFSKLKVGAGGGAPSGKAAVRNSRETARLRYMQQIDGKARSRLYTSQRVKDRTFHFVAGVWIDSRFKKTMAKKLTKIEAFSTEYFALLVKRPELAGYLAFSTSLVIVTGADTAIEITPKKKPQPKLPTKK